MHICKDYGDTLDFMGYTFLCAPDDFPPEDQVNIRTAIANIDGGVSAVAAKTANTEALELFERCQEILREALKAFDGNDAIAGQKKLLSAKEIFERAGKLRRNKK